MDILSLFLIEGIILLVFGITMLVATFGQEGQEGNYWFAASNFCGAAGLLLRPIMPVASPLVAMLIPNLLLFVELALMYRAVAAFVGRGEKVWWLFLTLAAAATAVSAHAVYVSHNRVTLAQAITVVTIVVPACSAFVLVRFAMPRIRIPMYSMGALFALYAGNNLLRVFHDWVQPQQRFNHILFDRTILAALSVSYLLMSEALLRLRLLDMATVDPLTGVLNRRALESEAKRQMELARRNGCPISAMMVDIDQFKSINDTHGHDAGDRTLQAVGEVLMASVTQGDLVARLGGDEFLLLLAGRSTAEAEEIAQGIRVKLAAIRLMSEKGAFPVFLSIGIATLEAQQTRLDLLMKLSDRSLYAVKSARPALVYGRRA